MSGICQVEEPDSPGLMAATRKTPALTIAAECRYALTGVGAVIAPGSQKCSGAMADLLIAPTITSTSHTRPEERNTKAPMAAIPSSWTPSRENPPP